MVVIFKVNAVHAKGEAARQEQQTKTKGEVSQSFISCLQLHQNMLLQNHFFKFACPVLSGL